MQHRLVFTGYTIRIAFDRSHRKHQSLDLLRRMTMKAFLASMRMGISVQASCHRDKDNVEVTAKFGMSCNLVFGIPSVIHNLLTSESYVQAIRKNIYAGGDSCGRAILLGAVFGAAKGINEKNGIPQTWIDHLSQKEEIDDLISKL